jgi:hypothetical protein
VVRTASFGAELRVRGDHCTVVQAVQTPSSIIEETNDISTRGTSIVSAGAENPWSSAKLKL